MKLFKKYMKILLGCLLIAVTLNLFYLNEDLIPSGSFGLAMVFNLQFGISLEKIFIFINLLFFIMAYIYLSYDDMKKLAVSFIAVPTFIWLTKGIHTYINLEGVDKLLIALYGGVLIGIGNKLIYKEHAYASASDVITIISRGINSIHYNLINYVIDLILLLISIFMFGLEGAMYSLISIIIIEYLSKRATLGISDAKVFYIITKKDKEVKNYIIEELGYELTIFDVKGGFLKTKNRVLMSVIPTKDYYKLREGVQAIDQNAFISITDSYEVLNPNKTVKKLKENR